MGTESTIAEASGVFRLYEDLNDQTPAPVYLTLTGVEFEATPRGVTLTIPRHVWAVLAEAGASCANTSAADLSDEEIRAIAEKAHAETLPLKDAYGGWFYRGFEFELRIAETHRLNAIRLRSAIDDLRNRVRGRGFSGASEENDGDV